MKRNTIDGSIADVECRICRSEEEGGGRPEGRNSAISFSARRNIGCWCCGDWSLKTEDLSSQEVVQRPAMRMILFLASAWMFSFQSSSKQSLT